EYEKNLEDGVKHDHHTIHSLMLSVGDECHVLAALTIGARATLRDVRGLVAAQAIGVLEALSKDVGHDVNEYSFIVGGVPIAPERE
ncbi:unnamed protein product, partial [Chrysoparadoxa australica]